MATKYLLREDQIPRHWYNILADLKSPPAPVLHPQTRKPVTPDDLAPLFPMAIIEQEMSTRREVPIPGRGAQCARAVATFAAPPRHPAGAGARYPAHIYYKYEGVSSAGSHKPNTAVAQAFYNAKAGVRRLATETGAGQWGSSLAFAGQLFGLEVHRLHGAGQLRAEALPPLDDAHLGRGGVRLARRTRPTPAARILATGSAQPGILGIAISEAVEDAATHEDTKYCARVSVLNHVLHAPDGDRARRRSSR